MDKAALLARARARQFLEVQRVPTPHGCFYYGTSLDTVREVAASGRVCLMSLDLQGAKVRGEGGGGGPGLAGGWVWGWVGGCVVEEGVVGQRGGWGPGTQANQQAEQGSKVHACLDPQASAGRSSSPGGLASCGVARRGPTG